MDRRTFLHAAGAGAGLLAVGGISSLPSSERLRPSPAADRHPLRFPRSVSPRGLTLVAGVGEVDVAGTRASAWTFGGDVPGPTIRARRGDRAQILLRNALAEPTVVHWHGLHVPVECDGHPRLAIPPGATLPYAFTVNQRAAMHWYHPHAHMRTAAQVYHGLAGLFIVADDEEDALGLPAGDREILLVLQDRRTTAGDANAFQYDATGPDMMQGYLGDTPFGNGVPRPSLEVDSALYRLRILNASNARIYRLALDGGAPLVVIGNDGGLLPAPARVDHVDLAPAERVDLLVDLGGVPAGGRVMLRSVPFTIPGGMGMGGGMGRGMGRMGGAMGGQAPQGAAMELLELVVGRRVREPARMPARLPGIATYAGQRVGAERTFTFTSRMMRHAINGRGFDMSRVDVRVPLGRLERWTFVNDDMFAHPVHVHATHFQVAGRSGGRGAVQPWERGWKDTVLVLPGERVDVLLRFDAHRGLFLLHCHNLEHEDGGMMLNFEVE